MYIKKLLNNIKGFSLVESLVGVALIGGLSLTVMQIQKLGVDSENYERRATTLAKLSRRINQILTEPNSCIANFRGKDVTSNANLVSLGLSEDGTVIKLPVAITTSAPNNQYGEALDNFKPVIEVNRIAIESFNPIFGANHGVATLKADFKDIFSDTTLTRYFNLVVKTDGSDLITHCYNKAQATADALCDSLGGTMELVGTDWRCIDLHITGNFSASGDITASLVTGDVSIATNLSNTGSLGTAGSPVNQLNVDDGLANTGNITTTNLNVKLAFASANVDSTQALEATGGGTIEGGSGEIHLTNKECGNFTDPDILGGGGVARQMLTGVMANGTPYCASYAVPAIINWIVCGGGGGGGKGK